MRTAHPELPHIIERENIDRRYFTAVPRLVLLLTRSPYDLALWVAVKDIAGEDGECFLSTRELAIYAKMSSGKVVSCREYLIKVGLLKGEVRKDPGYSQAVYHLRIPDFWDDSVQAARDWIKLKDRIALAEKVRQAQSVHEVNALLAERSSGERKRSCGEPERSCGEPKKIHKEDPKEKPKEPEIDVLDHLFDCALRQSNPGPPVQRPRHWESVSDDEFAVCQRVAQHWTKGKFPFPDDIETHAAAATWIVKELHDGNLRAAIETIDRYHEHYETERLTLTIAGPASLRKVLPSFVANGCRTRRGGREGEWTEEELDAARQEALDEEPIDVEVFLGKEA